VRFSCVRSSLRPWHGYIAALCTRRIRERSLCRIVLPERRPRGANSKQGALASAAGRPLYRSAPAVNHLRCLGYARYHHHETCVGRPCYPSRLPTVPAPHRLCEHCAMNHSDARRRVPVYPGGRRSRHWQRSSGSAANTFHGSGVFSRLARGTAARGG